MSQSRPRYLERVGKDKLYSVGQVAEFCGVAPRTVAKWFDAGKIDGYRLPAIGKSTIKGVNGGDRRITRTSLIRFMKEYKFPLPVELVGGESSAFLFGISSQIIADGLTKAGFEVTNFGSGLFDLALGIADKIPGLLVMDAAIGRSETLSVIRKIRLLEEVRTGGPLGRIAQDIRPEKTTCNIVVLVGDDETRTHEYTEAGASKVLLQSTATALLSMNPVQPAALTQKEMS